MARHTGLPNASNLLRPTGPSIESADGPLESLDENPAEMAEDTMMAEGRGETAEDSRAAAPRTRRSPRKPTLSGKTKARNVRLTDDVHDRLWMLARQRKISISAVANELLDRNLPRWEVKRAV